MIATVEDDLLELVKDKFGAKLRAVDALPGEWDTELLKKLIISAPAVYVGFMGGPKITASDAVVGIESRWGFFAITAHASGEKARRRGDLLQIGAYEIIKHLVPLVHNHTIADVGTLKVESIDNLYNGAIEGKGVTLYAVLCSLPIYFETTATLADLDDFETYSVDWDLAPMDEVIDAQSEVTLTQS